MIYFLLSGKDFSALHRLAADEVWHSYAGSALLIHFIDADGNYQVIKLGQNVESGEQFHCMASAGYWFGSSLETARGYALAGCTVAPRFDFSDFEMGSRHELLVEYPQYREVIMRLTRW